MATLKPCPFCASRQVKITTHDGPATIFAVHCNTCTAEGPIGTTAAEAAELWNTRATPDAGDGDGGQQ